MKDKTKTCNNCYFCDGQKCSVKNCKIKAYEENCIYWTEKTGGGFRMNTPEPISVVIIKLILVLSAIAVTIGFFKAYC